MAMHRKLDAIRSLNADIVILPEVAQPEIVASKSREFDPGLCVWGGKNAHKGLAVLASSSKWQLAIDDSYDPANGVVIPVRVRGPIDFNLLAVWSIGVNFKKSRVDTPGAILRAIELADSFCREKPLIVAGDFNNSVIWDRPSDMNSMAAIDAVLGSYGLASAYHHSTRCALGAEDHATIYWRDRKKDGPRYHIDYIYLPATWLDGSVNFHVGDFDNWVATKLSDHVPLSVEIPIVGLT